MAAVAPAFSRVKPKALGVLEYSGSWAGTYLLRRGLFLPHELPEVMDAGDRTRGSAAAKATTPACREPHARSQLQHRTSLRA